MGRIVTRSASRWRAICKQRGGGVWTHETMVLRYMDMVMVMCVMELRDRRTTAWRTVVTRIATDSAHGQTFGLVH